MFNLLGFLRLHHRSPSRPATSIWDADEPSSARAYPARSQLLCGTKICEHRQHTAGGVLLPTNETDHDDDTIDVLWPTMMPCPKRE